MLAPELVDQFISGNRLVPMDQQDRDECALPVADDRDRPSAIGYLKGAEDPEIHESTLPP